MSQDYKKLLEVAKGNETLVGVLTEIEAKISEDKGAVKKEVKVAPPVKESKKEKAQVSEEVIVAPQEEIVVTPEVVVTEEQQSSTSEVSEKV